MEKKSFSDVIREPQNIIAIGVTIISLCALVVSVMQTRIMTEQQALLYRKAKAEVWPQIQMGSTKSHNEEDYSLTVLNFSIGNAGVGPAIITDVRVSYKGEVVSNWGDLFRKFEMPKEIKSTVGNSNINGLIIRPGEGNTYLNLNDNLPLANEFLKHLKGIKIETWYKSIYEDKWKLTYQNRAGVTEEADPNFSLPDKEQFED